MAPKVANDEMPQLTGDAERAVHHRGSHLQIIAGAGSGKTEVVAQRVVDLLADQVEPAAIVAFTFTERAAEELKSRIARRVEQRLGRSTLDRLNGLYVGTIHAFCFRLLQQHVPRYETYDVLDDNQVTAFLVREERRLGLRELDPQRRLFASIEAFLKSVDVVENELLEPASMSEPFATVLDRYYEALDRYRLLTYGQQIARAVRELEDANLRASVHESLAHLIVDEYQDVNPAQERLIELLAGRGVELCVVGDDHQAIYQWRGSDVSNIVEFSERYEPVATYEISVNRRSIPELIRAANEFARSIPDRIERTMQSHRPAAEGGPEIIAWTGETEAAEAARIAEMIQELHDRGVPYRDIAVLVRSRYSYPRLLEQFTMAGIPVQPGGRTGLFDQPEARVLGRTFAWLTDIDWRDQRGPSATVTEAQLLDEYRDAFQLSSVVRRRLRRLLRSWKELVPREDRVADLVGEFYELLEVLEIRAWDLDDPIQLNRVGTLARFSSLLADYESVRRRARPDPNNPGEQVGGQDRGSWYYKSLAIHIINYAQGAYEGFDGEADYVTDAVDLTTVHRAKGLEWPVVFVPCLTAKRFPSTKTGSRERWLVPREMFDAARYEGTDADERRLFYVAITRARDWLSVSRHERVTANAVEASPYYREFSPPYEVDPAEAQYPTIEPRASDDEEITITFSELAAFLKCGFAFRLRNLVGFQPRLAPELGYGKVVHHVLRTVAERTQATGEVPSEGEIHQILENSFFLPSANKPAHRNLKRAAHRLVTTYTQRHQDDLMRVWQTERPFELHLDGVTISGRADVILDKDGGQPEALAIVDYKTSTDGEGREHDLQVQIYADAGRREGLDVRGAYVHDLRAGERVAVPIAEEQIAEAETTVAEAAGKIRAREYLPNPGPQCRTCEVRTICPHGRA